MSVSRKRVLTAFAPALIAAAAIPFAAPQVVEASLAHPRLVVSGEQTRPERKVPIVGWGTVRLTSRVLPAIDCVNLFYGDLYNATEPGGAGNSEDVRAYGEVLQWTATGHMNAIGGELSARCRTSSFNAWAAAEPGLEKQYERVTIGEGTESTERLAIKQVKRELPSVPWNQEARGTEIGGSNTFFLTTGIAGDRTERANVEAEEAQAGIPTEHRTGCYPQPPFTEVVREPGVAEPRETELALRSDPKGCVRIDIISPEVGIEEPFQGTLEPKVLNGARNCLSPMKWELEGTEEGHHMESVSGPGYARTMIPIKECGFANLELTQLR
jgi:hypothetical protein